MEMERLESVSDALRWLRLRGVRGMTSDSRAITPGNAFVAWPGRKHDGRQFVASALAAGAAACLVDADDALAGFDFDPRRVAAIAHLKERAGHIASSIFNEPSRELSIIASTGTNGKTSTTWWTAQALTALGARCGVVGTLGIGTPPDAVTPTGLTSPDPVVLQRVLRGFVDQGLVACAIEASSIGLAERRLAGTRIAIAIFTNFTQDHLDHHGDMAAYWQAKRALFDWPGLAAAVINVDDAQGARLAGELVERGGIDLWTYSTRADAPAHLFPLAGETDLLPLPLAGEGWGEGRQTHTGLPPALTPTLSQREREQIREKAQSLRLRARDIGYAGGGLRFEVVEGESTATVETSLIGDFNVSNLLGVIGALRSLGHPLPEITAALAQLTPVPGRMQRVAFDGVGPQVVVDYAHTPDALEKALTALQPFAAERGGALVCVFGCGGNRDAVKRPLMGAIAQRLAQRVVLTSDNPRDENPAFILLQIVAGLKGSQERVKVIEDRAKAIADAVRDAADADVILVAGKGHEDYQEVRGVKRPFSDLAQASAALQARAQRKGANA